MQTKLPAKTNSPTPKVQKTRTHILNISAALFSQRGYNATPLRDIAAAANMKAGSLYYHFESKEQLILEVLTIGIESIYENVVNRIEALPGNSPTRTVLETAATGHLEALLEKGDYTSTSISNYGQMPASIQSEILKVRDKYEDLWRQLLATAEEKNEIRPGVDLKILRLSILSALNRTPDWYKQGELSVAEIARMQISIFWDGVARHVDK